SPVEQARLQVGDILVEMNALPLATLEDLSRAVSSARPGQELSFVALRDRALISGTIKLPH
ncbi:MAG TPA: PDZ domain-containing protein, partial [Ktedonobacteraceae bacterium]|nr:PDZ domain-containing protein [Ktedonobacteraceae bacterium]